MNRAYERFAKAGVLECVHLGPDRAVAVTEWDHAGRISWVPDLAEIPAQYGVTNV